MKLRGVLDKSFGNFITLRGYARMGDLERISVPGDSFQRNLIDEHKDEMVSFLSNAEFLFFPEVILGAVLESDEGDMAKVARLNEAFVKEGSFKADFEQFKIQYSATKSKSEVSDFVYDYFRRATLEVLEKELNKKEFRKFKRIDGNHRLTATTENPKFADYNIPYCLILFRNESEANKFGRALFHNINYKHIPLTLEENLKLILDDKHLFPDDKLKESPSFGWQYYFARVFCGDINYDSSNIIDALTKAKRTFFLKALMIN